MKDWKKKIFLLKSKKIQRDENIISKDEYKDFILSEVKNTKSLIIDSIMNDIEINEYEIMMLKNIKRKLDQKNELSEDQIYFLRKYL